MIELHDIRRVCDEIHLLQDNVSGHLCIMLVVCTRPKQLACVCSLQKICLRKRKISDSQSVKTGI